MDINFPLIMVVLVGAGAGIWIFDSIVLAPKRRKALAALQQQLPEWSVEGSSDSNSYVSSAEHIEREPIAVEYAKSFTPVLFIVLILRSFVVEPFQIPSSSMVPTLAVGDFILVNKYTYGLRLPVLRTKVVDVDEPKRGDVMVFFPPHKPDTYYIKRVIGLPGDQITYKRKKLYINGELAPQELLAQLPARQPEYRLWSETLGDVKHDVRTSINRHGKDGISITVKPGHYFMMGDNRDNSLDSRTWGQVSETAIVGKAFAIWMHWDSFFSLPSFKRVGIIP